MAYNIVQSRLTKGPYHKVNGFVASVSQKNRGRVNLFYAGYLLLELSLKRIRITVYGFIIWIFIGIEKHRCLPLVFISSRRNTG